MNFDPVALIETGYQTQSDAASWLHAVAKDIVPVLSADWQGGAAYFYGPDGPTDLVEVRRDGIHYDPDVLMLSVAKGYASATPEQVRDGVLAMRTPGISSLADAVGELPGEGVALLTHEPMRDSAALIVHTGEGLVAVFCNAQATRLDIDEATKRLWQRVAVHLGAAARLVGQDADTSAPEVEAVISPGGEIAHAAGEARSEHAREVLRAAAKNMDRARTRAGRADAGAALELWRGLLAGRWSLVDHFDTDGRRFILAHRNDPNVPGPAALSRRQRQIVFYASVGWSNKEIGYALGLAGNTVSAHVTSALEKMGIATRAELVRMSTDIAMAAMQAAAGGGDSEPHSAENH